ncbi:MAG TPA: hypothetical protein VNL70_09075, partial [Tepidisphaeraceae bacterium]|nr:hypothetical protein [Tepidisphaeraceae bacterium]
LGGVRYVTSQRRGKRVVVSRICLWWLVCGNMALLLVCGGCDPGSADASPAGASHNYSSGQPIPEVIDGLPVLVADAAHSILDARKAGRPYLLEARRASAGVILHAGQIALEDPERLLRPPNAVQMLYERGVYSVAWPQPGQVPMVKLQPATLRVLRGSAFRGFSAGKQAYLAIGFQESDPSSGKVTFVAYWAGSVIFH